MDMKHNKDKSKKQDKGNSVRNWYKFLDSIHKIIMIIGGVVIIVQLI